MSVQHPPSPPSRQAQLEHLLELSLDMRQKAEAADWAAVLSLEMERQALLLAFFAVAPLPGESEVIATALEGMRAANAAVMGLSAQTRQQIAVELRALETGRKGAQAYDLNR